MKKKKIISIINIIIVFLKLAFEIYVLIKKHYGKKEVVLQSASIDGASVDFHDGRKIIVHPGDRVKYKKSGETKVEEGIVYKIFELQYKSEFEYLVIILHDGKEIRVNRSDLFELVWE